MNKIIFIRLFSGLNFFVPERLKQKNIQVQIFGKPSVKDVIESVGVPHTEFELVTLNGEPTEIDANVFENDQLVVYPHFYQFAIEEKKNDYRFVLDVHLGKLAALLRLLGFDCIYNNRLVDNEIIEIAFNENRTILSRDLGIFKNSRVKSGYFPRSQNPKTQLNEIIDRYNLNGNLKPFSRCMKCNGELYSVDKEMVINELEENTSMYYTDFYKCKSCNRVYWKGSHFRKMMEIVENYSNN